MLDRVQLKEEYWVEEASLEEKAPVRVFRRSRRESVLQVSPCYHEQKGYIVNTSLGHSNVVHRCFRWRKTGSHTQTRNEKEPADQPCTRTDSIGKADRSIDEVIEHNRVDNST